MSIQESLEPDPEQADSAEKIIGREQTGAFQGLIGMQLEVQEQGRAVARLEVGPQHFQPEGVVHGGVIFSLADTAAGLALHSLTKLDKRLATVEAKINMLAPTFGGELVAEAHVAHKGKNLAVIEVQIYNHTEQGHKRVAIMLATFMMLPR